MSHQLWGKRVVSGTTDGANADLVFLADAAFGVQVTNVSGNANLWFTVSEPGGKNTVPLIGGTESEWCAASVVGQTVQVRHAAQFGTTIQLISSASVTYTVSLTGARLNA